MSDISWLGCSAAEAAECSCILNCLKLQLKVPELAGDKKDAAEKTLRLNAADFSRPFFNWDLKSSLSRN
jgi:hypothetical protein